MTHDTDEKTVHVIHMVPLGMGGITSLFLNLCEEMKDEGFVFDCLTFRNREEPNERNALRYGGKKYVVPMDRYQNAAVRGVYKFFKTISVLKESQADIIHIHASFPYDILVGVSAKLAGVRHVIFHSHNSSLPHCGAAKRAVMALTRSLIPLVSDQNLACSELAADYMFPGSILRQGRYQVLNNGIPVQKYAFSPAIRQEYRKKLDLDGRWVVGHVGRFTAQKNHGFLLQIFAEIHQKEPNAVLLLLGTGELEDTVQSQAETLRLGSSVIFYGATDQVPELMQAMDCFLLPSLYEGLPVSVLEAQAAGLPVYLSDTITGETDIRGDLRYLPLSAPPKEWADTILAGRSVPWNRAAECALCQGSRYDISCVAEQVRDLYMRMAER
ncbi:MAG: glycosyltransferase [Clostridiales bacterium]|nr:glycosyltransferase [Clostridiales bacterium]